MTQSECQAPRHLAMIMDGNGRWAEQRGLPRLMGHRAGSEVVRRVVAFAARRGVRLLTLYAFSSDNWKRPSTEVIGLMQLFEAHLRIEGRRLAAEGIRLEVTGRRDRLPARLLRAIVRAESLTAAGGRMTLRLAIDYSSRHAIAEHFSAQVPDPSLSPRTGRLSADVDLLIRTGGERRLSDFLLWESAYAELAFTDTPWPALTEVELERHFADFAARERRFGALPTRASA